MENSLRHHGILGQKWGVRRYQNENGDWTDEGLKRRKALRGNSEVTIEKGHRVYRVSANDKSDIDGKRIYVNADPSHKDVYAVNFGSSTLLETGKLYVHEYITTNELKIPSKKVMEKIELGLLKDPDIKSEIIDSLVNKGMTVAQAKEAAKAYSVGRAALYGAEGAAKGAVVGMYSGGILGFYGSTVTCNGVPLAVGAVGGATVGSVAGGILGFKSEKNKVLNFTRMSYGDKANEILNSKLQERLAAKGYNAMKDYNDRRAFGRQGEDAVIVFDSANNLKLDKVNKMDRDSYSKAYANSIIDRNPNLADTRKNLETQGGKVYDMYMNEGALYRKRKAEKAKEIKEARASEEKQNNKEIENISKKILKNTELEKYGYKR